MKNPIRLYNLDDASWAKAISETGHNVLVELIQKCDPELLAKQLSETPENMEHNNGQH